jgi:hypothetical protein
MKPGETLMLMVLFFSVIIGYVSLVPQVDSINGITQITRQDVSEEYTGNAWIDKASSMENVTVVNGSLTLQKDESSGRWVSDRINYNDEFIEHDQIRYETDLRGGKINITFEYSNFFDFDPSNKKEENSLVDGPGSLDLQNLNKSKYARIRVDLNK